MKGGCVANDHCAQDGLVSDYSHHQLTSPRVEACSLHRKHSLIVKWFQMALLHVNEAQTTGPNLSRVPLHLRIEAVDVRYT